MVSRKMRSYKEKKPMTTFGQFILPLAVIMAIALLFLSVRLFFFNPLDSKKQTGTPDVSSHLSADSGDVQNNAPDSGTSGGFSAAPVEAEDPYAKSGLNAPAKTDGGKTETAPKPAMTAKPVTTVKPALTAKPVTTTKPVATTKPATAKPADTKTVTAAKPAGVQTSTNTKPAVTQTKTESAGGVKRWDIQIGGFGSRENALQLLKQAREQGYEVYLSEAVHEGQPFHRVRVKNDKGREEALRISEKLKEQGYPVYVIPIK